jgi:uncharacterized repeat protein (TIGR01451 family)
MVHKAVYCVEALEGRSLLSGITYSLTTDQPVYQVGQTIQFTFTETNTGDQPVTVAVSPTDFTVSRGPTAIWQSDPGDAGQSPSSVTLQPGQSISQTASWDGTIPYTLGSPTGSGQTWMLNEWGSFTVSNPNAPQGDTATFQITDPITATLTTDMPVYQMGQPVQVTYTESNTSDRDLTFLDGDPTAITFWRNGVNVTPVAYPDVILATPEALAAHNTVTWSQTWNGIPEAGPYDLANLTGTFVASYGPEGDPQQYTAAFQITPPSSWDIVSSVTSDQSVYQAGQMVNLTFTETNAGDQPVMVVVGQQSFSVAQNGQSIWSTLGASTSTEDTWGILPPGQTITQTEGWNGTLINGQSAGTGTFVATNMVDPNGSTATFQVVAPAVSDPPTDPPGTGTNDPPAGDPPPQDPGTTGTTGAGYVNGGPGTGTVLSTNLPVITFEELTNHKVYKVGQSVSATLKITASGMPAPTLPVGKGREVITVTDALTTVYKAARMVRPSKVKGEPLRKAFELTAVWSGRTNQPGIHTLKPGSYVIAVTYDDLPQGVADIEIGRGR